MKLSTKAKYGLKACFVLAYHYQKRLVSAAELDRETGISCTYLEQLLSKLKRAHIVSATRGSQGGYALCSAPKQVSIGHIMRALEGNLDVVDCLAHDGCDQAQRCPTRAIWKRLSDGLNRLADSISLQDMLDDDKSERFAASATAEESVILNGKQIPRKKTQTR